MNKSFLPFLFLLLFVPFVTAVGQPAARLEITGLPRVIEEGQAVLVTVQAVNADGSPTTNCPSPIQLRILQSKPAAPVISEVHRHGSIVEVSNPGAESLDLSGWELQALTDYPLEDQYPNARLRLPAGTVLPPGGVFTWSDRGQAPGSFPNFVSAKPFVGRYNSGPGLLRLLARPFRNGGQAAVGIATGCNAERGCRADLPPARK